MPVVAVRPPTRPAEVKPVEPAKPQRIAAQPAARPFDEHDILPSTYGRPTAVLLPKNPEWLFLYWDFDAATRMRLVGGAGDIARLRVSKDGVEVYAANVPVDVRRYYVRIPAGGGKVRAELGLHREGEFQPILVSNDVSSPRAAISRDTSISHGAPAWAGDEKGKIPTPFLMSEEQFRALFPDEPVGTPWYRPGK
jgi:hypothetical protein